MRKTRAIPLAIITIILVLIVPVRGQEAGPLPVPKTRDYDRVNKIFQLKYIEPSRLTDLVSKMIPGLPPSADDRLKVLVISGCFAYQMEAVEEVVKTLDVPQPPAIDVELTAYILAERPQQIPATDLPSELNEVIAQLKKTFNFPGFQLLNTAVIRTQDNESGIVNGAAGPANNYRLEFSRLNVISGERGPTIHISNLIFSFSSPEYTPDSKDNTWGGKPKDVWGAGLRTSIDIIGGQKVVVGKTSTQFPDRAVFLILMAKVVE